MHPCLHPNHTLQSRVHGKIHQCCARLSVCVSKPYPRSLFYIPLYNSLLCDREVYILNSRSNIQSDTKMATIFDIELNDAEIENSDNISAQYSSNPDQQVHDYEFDSDDN